MGDQFGDVSEGAGMSAPAVRTVTDPDAAHTIAESPTTPSDHDTPDTLVTGPIEDRAVGDQTVGNEDPATAPVDGGAVDGGPVEDGLPAQVDSDVEPNSSLLPGADHGDDSVPRPVASPAEGAGPDPDDTAIDSHPTSAPSVSTESDHADVIEDPSVAAVHAAVGQLDDVDQAPLAEHADRYERVHVALQDVLADTDPGVGRA